MIEIYNNDCFDVFPEIEDNSIDLFVLDLPYANKKFGNCTSLAWDTPIDLDKMWVEIKRMMKPSAIIVFFCNTKFGYALIHSNPKWYRYDLIWEKSKKVGFLSANKMPLRKHENIYIFKNELGVYNPQMTERETDYKHTGKRSSEEHYSGKIDCKKIYKKEDGMFPTSILPEFEETHENIYIFKNEQGTYNPQKTEGHKPYKDDVRKKPRKCGLYGDDMTHTPILNKGERHPTSILPEFEEKDLGMIEGGYYRTKGGKPFKRMPVNPDSRHPTSIIPEFEKTILKFNNPHKTIHRTQKPVDLCEWLIKTYSNENDTVMDFTMGSGTVGEACQNTNRKFIGIERDPDIFKLAEDRLKKNEEE